MKIFFFVSACCLCSSTTWTQKLDNDTSKTYQLSEVVVTATRSPISAKDSPSPVEVIGSRDFQKINGTTVADVLRQASSIFLNDYGANSALKTISLRGTASQHLLVLVDGNRFNSFQNGLVDLSLLPLYDVERIEIVRGGSSALYGADALGGVVNIFTRRAISAMGAHSEVTGGSFGFQKYLLEVQGTLGNVGLLGGYVDERGRDDYPFEFSPSSSNTTLRRSNADFHRRHAYLSGSFLPDDHSSLSLFVKSILADRGAPGSVSFPSEARQNDQDINVLARYAHSPGEGIDLELQTGLHYTLQNFVDPNPFFPIDSYYKNRFVNFSPQIRLALTTNNRLVVGGELAEGTLESNDFDGKISRVQKSVYVSNESYFQFEREIFDRLSLYQTVRYDNISDVAYALTPKIGVNVRIVREGELHLRATLGQSFRAPTFNDMYYRGISNPQLKPERSTTFDAGVTTEVAIGGRQSMELTYFHLDTENRILFDLTSFMPVNIGRALSRGVEVAYAGHFLDDLINVRVNYTFTDARKRNRSSETDSTFDQQLRFVPKHLANVGISVQYPPFTLNVLHSLVSSRFTAEDHSTSLPPYRLTNANILVDVPLGSSKLFAKLEVNNLFDSGYEVFPAYPMPKRNYRATVGVSH